MNYWKHELESLLEALPSDKDIQLTIKRHGDRFTFYNYEQCNLTLGDDALVFDDGQRHYRTLYENIIGIEYKPVFQDKRLDNIIEGEYR